MAGENDSSDDDLQQQPNDAPQTTFGDENLDKMLGNFLDDSERSNGQTTEGAKPQGATQQPAGTQQQQPATGATGGQQQPVAGQTSTQQTQQVQQIPAQARRFGSNFYSDAQGNIFSARGELIAKAGSQHAAVRKVMPYVNELERENATYKQRHETFEAANSLAKAAGLSLDEQGVGLQLMVSWKKDPVNTIKTMLTHAQQRGIDVSAIQQGGSGIDPSVIRSTVQELLTEALKPFMPLAQQAEESRAHAEQSQHVIAQYNEFIEEHPAAVHHQDVIARIMADRNYSAREAFFQLQAYAGQNRLDINQPLGPQIAARQGEVTARQAPNGGGNNRNLPNMSGGRSSNGNGQVPAGSNDLAGADDSWDSVVRQTLARHGINT